MHSDEWTAFFLELSINIRKKREIGVNGTAALCKMGSTDTGNGMEEYSFSFAKSLLTDR
jgi:hypothetical protein